MSNFVWVGLDVHVESITAAMLEGDSPEVEVVKLSGDLNKVRRLFRRLAKRGAVRACYEASGAGFVLQRVLSNDGFHCEVIAPSLIPRRPGDHRKTDPRSYCRSRSYTTGHPASSELSGAVRVNQTSGLRYASECRLCLS